MKELASIKDETIQNYQAENQKLSNDIIDNLKERDVTIKQEQQEENQTQEEVKTGKCQSNLRQCNCLNNKTLL